MDEDADEIGSDLRRRKPTMYITRSKAGDVQTPLFFSRGYNSRSAEIASGPLCLDQEPYYGTSQESV